MSQENQNITDYERIKYFYLTEQIRKAGFDPGLLGTFLFVERLEEVLNSLVDVRRAVEQEDFLLNEEDAMEALEVFEPITKQRITEAERFLALIEICKAAKQSTEDCLSDFGLE